MAGKNGWLNSKLGKLAKPFLIRQISLTDDVCKVYITFEEFVFWSHGVWFYMLMKYNGVLMIFTKVMGIYEYSLPWCHFWSSVRDLLIWKNVQFTKLIGKCNGWRKISSLPYFVHINSKASVLIFSLFFAIFILLYIFC